MEVREVPRRNTKVLLILRYKVEPKTNIVMTFTVNIRVRWGICAYSNR